MSLEAMIKAWKWGGGTEKETISAALLQLSITIIDLPKQGKGTTVH